MTGEQPETSSEKPGWSLRRRLDRAIIAVVALMLGLVAVIAALIVFTKLSGDQLVDRWDPARLAAESALAAMVNQETGIRGFSEGHETVFLQPYLDYLQPQQDAVRELRGYLAGEPELVDLLDDFDASVQSWREQVAEPLIAQTREGGQSDAITTRESTAAFDTIRENAAELGAGIEERREDAARNRRRAFIAVWIAIGVGTGALLLTAALLARGLRGAVLDPIGGLVAQTRHVASGSLEQRIVQAGATEIQALAADVDAMRQRLAGQIERIERDRRRLEQRSGELARSNSDLEQFAYVASHDLSEPLRKVTNFCQLLERQYADKLDDRAREYIWFAVDGARRMQQLIGDLLAFSRVGRSTEHFTLIDLDAALDQAIETLAAQIEASGAQVVRSELPTLQGDPTLMVALLVNLVGNAVKYRDPERTPRIEVTAGRVDGGWRLEVSDNGIGIDAQYADRIFTIFQRLHLRDAYGGTGIGLALCRRIVEFHQGEIRLAEGSQAGARFVITLPEHQVDLETHDEPEAHDHPGPATRGPAGGGRSR